MAPIKIFKSVFTTQQFQYKVKAASSDIIAHISTIPQFTIYTSESGLELDYYKSAEFKLYNTGYIWTKGYTGSLKGLLQEEAGYTTVTITTQALFYFYLSLLTPIVIGLFLMNVISSADIITKVFIFLLLLILVVLMIWFQSHNNNISRKRFEKFMSKKFQVAEIPTQSISKKV